MNFEEFKSFFQKREIEIISGTVAPHPVVSVCVQTYQHEAFIEDCLKGILKQKTNFPFEILLGEDGSTDNTRKICVEYARRYPHLIKLFLHKRENQIKIFREPSANFNSFYNLFSANGKYIAFCEGDDIWTDSLKLQKEVDFLERNAEFVLAYHSFASINELNEKVQTEIERNQPKVDLDEEDLQMLKYHPLLLCTCFRNVFKEIPRQITQVINVDSFVFSILGTYGKGKFLLDVKPSQYRTHNGGIWSERTRQKQLYSKIITFKNLSEYYWEKGHTDLSKYYKLQAQDVIKMLLYRSVKTFNFHSALHSLKEWLSLKTPFEEKSVKF